MNIQLHMRPAYDNLLAFAGSSKIILLHPASQFRSLAVARLLGDSAQKTYYYALDIDDINLFHFLTGLINELAKQHASFGRHLNVLPQNVLQNPYKHLDLVLKTFLDELSDFDDGDFILLLDEFDRADPADDIHRFVERLSHLAPERCTIVLNGRTLPRLPWLSMMAKRHAVILRDDELIQKDFYGNCNAADASLKVLSLGPGYVFLDDRLVDNWEGHLPRLLLFFVMDRPEVTRNQICEVFWPDLHIDQAVNVFHVTKRRLHKALGVDILSHDGAYYRINPDIPFYFDAFEFVESLLLCRHGDPPDAFQYWQNVAKLYRGPFLQGHSDGWIEERREAYGVANTEALTQIADIWLERGNDELALLTLGKAINADYSSEAIHLKLLRLYVRLGRRAEAVAHYRELEKWAKVNKRPLGAETQAVFTEITA